MAITRCRIRRELKWTKTVEPPTDPYQRIEFTKEEDIIVEVNDNDDAEIIIQEGVKNTRTSLLNNQWIVSLFVGGIFYLLSCPSAL